VLVVGVDSLVKPRSDARHARLGERGVWSKRSVFQRFLSGKQFVNAMASPSKPSLPAQAEGSMPEGLRDLFGFSEQDCE